MLHNTHSFCLLTLLPLALIHCAPASAQDASGSSDAIRLIADTAKSICGDFVREGSTVSGSASGEVSASLLALLKGLADLGIEGDGSFVAAEYANVLQTDLSTELRSVRECQLSVFGMLADRLLPSSEGADNDDSENVPEAPAFIGSVGDWIGWGKQESSEWSIRVSFANAGEPVVSYDSIPCSAIWRPIEVASFEARFREILIDGSENCVNGGVVVLRIVDSNTMSYTWEGSNQSAIGELKRIAD